MARLLIRPVTRRLMGSIVLAADGCRKAIDMGQLQADAGATVHGVMWTVTDQSKALRVLRGGEVGETLVGHSCIAAKAATTAKVLLGLSRLWTVARGAIVPCRRLPVTLRKTIGVAGLTCCPSLTSRGRMLTDGVDSLIRDSSDKARWPAIRHPDEVHDHRPQHRYAVACGSPWGRSKESACLMDEPINDCAR